jgi:hypothetical protein
MRGLRRNSRLARFEQLEARHLLSVAGSTSPRPLLISGSSAPAVAMPAITNQVVTTNPGVQQMPSVAVDPNNPDHVVIAYMDYSLASTGYAGIGVAASNDRGKDWHSSSLPLPVGFEQGAANPIAKFDGEGHVFVSFMAATFLGRKPPITNPNGADPDTGDQYRTYGFTADNGVFVARSDDGGVTWGIPVAVASHLYDGHTQVPFEIIPDMAIDTNKSSPNYGNIYVVWSRYYPIGEYPGEPDSQGGSQLQFAVSTDTGSTFELRPHIDDTVNSAAGLPPGLAVANWVKVAVGPQGYVYVAYYLFGAFVVLHSQDAGRTFDPNSSEAIQSGRHVVFGTTENAADPVAGGALARLPGWRTQVVRSIVADPIRPDTVYAAEALGSFDTIGNELDSDIGFARSQDNSLTWQTLQLTATMGP